MQYPQGGAEMNRRRIFKAILGGLLGLQLIIYIAAKFDTFTRLDPHKPGIFFRKHVLYWAGMALTAFLMWLTERLFRDRDSKPPGH